MRIGYVTFFILSRTFFFNMFVDFHSRCFEVSAIFNFNHIINILKCFCKTYNIIFLWKSIWWFLSCYTRVTWRIDGAFLKVFVAKAPKMCEHKTFIFLATTISWTDAILRYFDVELLKQIRNYSRAQILCVYFNGSKRMSGLVSTCIGL
jgi:hypothetical protein